MSDFVDKEANVEAGTEVVTAIVKVGIAGLGIVAGGAALPTLGAALASEVAGNVIPNLRRQRVENFINTLGVEVETLKSGVEHLQRRFNTPEFIDLLEDACVQSARAVTDERIRILAKLVKNSLNDEHLDYLYSKRLLSLLSELNDVEVILMKSYSVWWQSRDEFWQKYPDVYEALSDENNRAAGDTRPWRGQFAEYELHLVRLGLIGPPRSRSHAKELTAIGAELLRKMDHAVEEHMVSGQITDGTEGLQEVEKLLRDMRNFR
jgi:hypothetical protein